MAEAKPDFALGIMAKAPLPGQAKTRLIPLLGAAGAARLQAQLIERSLMVACAAAPGAAVLFTTGEHDWHGLQARFGVARQAQRGDHLGARMHTALESLSALREAALLIGTDCPVLRPEHLRAAAQALSRARMCFIPAEDGGYVLVGAREPVPQAFTDIAWGGPEVMRATRTRLHALGWHEGTDWIELAPLWDVDRPEDYRRALAMGLLTEAGSLSDLGDRREDLAL